MHFNYYIYILKSRIAQAVPRLIQNMITMPDRNHAQASENVTDIRSNS